MPDRTRRHLAAQYQAVHASDVHFGTNGSQYYPRILAFARDRGLRSILDYGCGKGRLLGYARAHAPGLLVHGYDPGNPRLSAWPAGPTYDLVTSTDVLEHIPTPHLRADLRRLAGYRPRAFWHLICLRPAALRLPDGQNAHCTVHPADWWARWLPQRLPGYTLTDTHQLPDHKALFILHRDPSPSCGDSVPLP